MTDAELMDANCIHGIAWYECDQCMDELGPDPMHTEDYYRRRC